MRKILLLLSVSILIFSCNKKSNSSIDDEEEPTPSPTNNALKAMIDTAASVSSYFYLWTDKLPENYTYNHANLNDFMNWIRSYSIEPGFNGPVDRWSFAIKKNEWDAVSTGRRGDFGLDVGFAGQNDLRIVLADKNGPAYKKGLRRGDRIIEVNNRTEISATQENINFLNNAIYLSSSPLNIKVIRNGVTISADLTVTSYTENPFALDTVLELQNKKIGYLVYNSFLGDTSAARNNFSSIFTNFKSENVDELIVDLRYNGGGYSFLSDLLANYIIPSGNNGKILNIDKFSEPASSNNDTVLVNKKGNIELSNVYFIVSSGTASASEGLINTVKPFLNVTLVGDTTHGKPVGYFAYPVADHYVFPVSIRTVNYAGVGNYFNGFAPQHLAADNFTYNWGDIEENSLNKAISLITGTQNQRKDPSQVQNNLRQAKILNKNIHKKVYPGDINLLSEDKIDELRKTIPIKH